MRHATEVHNDERRFYDTTATDTLDKRMRLLGTSYKNLLVDHWMWLCSSSWPNTKQVAEFWRKEEDLVNYRVATNIRTTNYICK
jgi:hypothetical protein